MAKEPLEKNTPPQPTQDEIILRDLGYAPWIDDPDPPEPDPTDAELEQLVQGVAALMARKKK